MSVINALLTLAAVIACGAAHGVEKRQIPGFGLSIFFKNRWVTQCGYVANFPANDLSIQVSSTLSVPDEILEKAARLVYHMTRFMPRPLFRALSQNVTVGVFVYRGDKPSAFPEYSDRKDTNECQGRCDGECGLTCTDDGTKFDDLWVFNGPRILVASQNLNCDRNLFDDPQFGLLNLLVSELSRTTERLMSPRASDLLIQSFQLSGDNAIWTPSLATSNAQNYFLQGSLAWFTATRLGESQTGGMNLCGETFCGAETQGRKLLLDTDPGLYHLLNDVYNNGRDYVKGGITVCRW